MGDTHLNKSLVEKWKQSFKQSNLLKEVPRPEIAFEHLTGEQQELVVLVRERLETSMLDNPLRIILHSPAGFGKSCVLNHIKYMLECKKRNNPDFDYRFAVLTGMCASHLKITTIHSAFKLPTNFGGNFLKNIQNRSYFKPDQLEEFKRIKIIILDEMSLVSLKLLHAIDLIMRSSDCDYQHLPFASRSLIICGDPLQPLTIEESPIFFPAYQKPGHTFHQTSLAYYEIKNVFRLTKPMRQFGNEPEQLKFRAFLMRLRYNRALPEDVDFVRSRLQSNLPETEQREFSEALHVFSLKCEVRMHNMKMLMKMFSDDEIIATSNGIHTLHIAISAPVFITRNLATDLAVVNGSRGHVVDVIFDAKRDQPDVFLRHIKCIIVDIEGYLGPRYASGRGSGFPVFRYSESGYCHALRDFARANPFPLQLGWATTKHKVQGLSLNRLAVNLGAKEIWAKVDYLCMSRVKRWDHIMFTDEHVAPERFTDKSNDIIDATELQQYEIRRLHRFWKRRCNAVCNK